MSGAKEKKSMSETARLTLVLFLICAICSALLGGANALTHDRIAAANAEKTEAALREVLEADKYEETPYVGDDSIVSTVYQAGDKGYVVEVTPTGFGGEIDMVVGIDTTGAVTGVSIISMSETSGLGDNAKKEDFRNQFVGATGELAVTKDGGTIDALTGATITSRAVTKGVSSALAAVHELG